MRIGTIAGLWRYPVKSMGGERLERAALSWRGIPGDRGWAVFDETRNGITGAKRIAALRGFRARYASEPVAGEGSPSVEITFPDGTTVRTDAADAGRRLGDILGRAVSLRALGPAGTEAAARLTTEGESEEVVRGIFGLLPDEPMPDMSALSGERLQRLREENFFDAFPIHLITRTTIRTLARLAPESNWDDRRFRANLYVDTDEAEGYPEFAWVGRKVRVGTAVIEVAMECPRCVMVTQEVDDVPKDPRIMRTLVRETRHAAGIYAHIAQEGVVRAGDEVELLPA
jgi:uncharacterized protein YcbX